MTEPFADAFPALRQSAYRTAYRLLGDRDAADDATQEALIRAYLRWGRLTRHPNPEAWVAVVTANIVRDEWRRRRRKSPVTDLLDGEGGLDTTLTVLAALSALPRRQRDVLVLRYVADLTEADVARALGCSLGAVKQHAHRGRIALEEALGGIHVP